MYSYETEMKEWIRGVGGSWVHQNMGYSCGAFESTHDWGDGRVSGRVWKGWVPGSGQWVMPNAWGTAIPLLHGKTPVYKIMYVYKYIYTCIVVCPLVICILLKPLHHESFPTKKVKTITVQWTSTHTTWQWSPFTATFSNLFHSLDYFEANAKDCIISFRVTNW